MHHREELEAESEAVCVQQFPDGEMYLAELAPHPILI